MNRMIGHDRQVGQQVPGRDNRDAEDEEEEAYLPFGDTRQAFRGHIQGCTGMCRHTCIRIFVCVGVC